MPSACATWTGPGALTVAIPSMSRMVRPASATALPAASMCSCQRGVSGSLPICVGLGGARDDHAAVVTAIALRLAGVNTGQADVAALLERHPQRHVEHEVLRGVRARRPGWSSSAAPRPAATTAIAYGPSSSKPRRRPVVDHVRVQGGLAAGGEPLDVRPSRTPGRAGAGRSTACRSPGSAGSAARRAAQPSQNGCVSGVGTGTALTWPCYRPPFSGSAGPAEDRAGTTARPGRPGRRAPTAPVPMSRTIGSGLLYSETS